MTDKRPHKPYEEDIKVRVSEGINEAREFAKTLDFEQVKSGEWFVRLLQKVVHSYDRNARAKYFQQKYPGLPADDISDILISVTARYAAVAGGVAGAAATSAQVGTLGTAGMTFPIFFSTIGSEMIYLSRIQLRLVLDLSVLYDLQLDADDPEDVLMVFGYAMGIAPTEMVGTLATRAAGGATTTLVKRYVSKNVLKAIQDFARRLGFKILQRTILKYTVPVVSAAVGGGYNYVSTRTLGTLAKNRFKNQHEFTDELQNLISRKHTYDLAFPAGALHVANLDGEFTEREYELYKALLSRMSFAEHTPAQLQRLVDDEERLLEAAARIESDEQRRTFLDVLVLMAVSDGELGGEEEQFLSMVANRLDMSLDLDDARRRAAHYGNSKANEEKGHQNAGRASATDAVATGAAAAKTAALKAAGDVAGRAATARKGLKDRLVRMSDKYAERYATTKKDTAKGETHIGEYDDTDSQTDGGRGRREQ